MIVSFFLLIGITIKFLNSVSKWFCPRWITYFDLKHLFFSLFLSFLKAGNVLKSVGCGVPQSSNLFNDSFENKVFS